jgi:hypothetical protein
VAMSKSELIAYPSLTRRQLLNDVHSKVLDMPTTVRWGWGMRQGLPGSCTHDRRASATSDRSCSAAWAFLKSKPITAMTSPPMFLWKPPMFVEEPIE